MNEHYTWKVIKTLTVSPWLKAVNVESKQVLKITKDGRINYPHALNLKDKWIIVQGSKEYKEGEVR